MKPALALLLLPALLAGCLAGQPPAPPGPTGQIDGAVVDHLLRPFGDHTVRLVQLDRTDQTSPLGGFTFRNVPVGFYTITTEGEGGRFATQVVDVQEGKITRTILQLMPVPGPHVAILAFSHESTADSSEPGGPCEPCGWRQAIPDQRPAEITLEAAWDEPLLNTTLGSHHGDLTIRVKDDRGFELAALHDVPSPAVVAIDGADLHPDARELVVEVEYGRQFLPDTDFTMRSVMTMYLGATKLEMLGVPA